MKKIFLPLFLLILVASEFSQAQLKDISLESTITKVQPMTGLVYWNTSSNNKSEAISLEFSYMLFNAIVKDSGVYNWDAVENLLTAVAGRGHQVIVRFRYVYPGYTTSVPDYILNRADYHETLGKSEGKQTSFPDWTNAELKRFTLEFYSKFAEKYDNDPRLAFIQVGFGLWAEYHIYSGPFILGQTFPSKEFQEEFFIHLNSVFKNIPWNISIDAASMVYSPFYAKPELKNIPFGLFDDSFMSQDHSGYNTTCWNFFDRTRYKTSPAGGEFNYYTTFDQQHVLDYPNGPYGVPFETFANNFHITYMLANDQPSYQTPERIKQASMAAGYKFKIERIQTGPDTSVFDILNYGVAPIYYDAYIAVNGIRASESLKLHAPGETKTYSVSADAENATVTIECDKLVPGQVIQFYGTQSPAAGISGKSSKEEQSYVYPNPVKKGGTLFLKGSQAGGILKYSIYNSRGQLELAEYSGSETVSVNTGNLNKGIYFLRTEQSNRINTQKLVIL